MTGSWRLSTSRHTMNFVAVNNAFNINHYNVLKRDSSGPYANLAVVMNRGMNHQGMLAWILSFITCII